MSKAVEIKNVSVVFGDNPKQALPAMDAGKNRSDVQKETNQILGVHNCNLTIEKGEIVVLMGLSGSGKSTLLRAINGLNKVVRGAIDIHDDEGRIVNVASADAKTLRQLRTKQVAMVFQQFALLPWRSVRENVGLGLELAGLNKRELNRRVDEQLSLVGLAEWGDRKVKELSGGMQQRVGLARALVTEAPILLMDEPFSALDPLIRTKLQDELLELQEKLNRTIIFVSHDLDEAFKLGNHIAIMEGGHIVQTGTPQDIFNNPKNDYVADFVQHMNPLSVLRVRDVMKAARTNVTYSQTLEGDILLKSGMSFLAGTEQPLGVTEDGKIIGELSKDDLVAALSR